MKIKFKYIIVIFSIIAVIATLEVYHKDSNEFAYVMINNKLYQSYMNEEVVIKNGRLIGKVKYRCMPFFIPNENLESNHLKYEDEIFEGDKENTIYVKSNDNYYVFDEKE